MSVATAPVSSPPPDSLTMSRTAGAGHGPTASTQVLAREAAAELGPEESLRSAEESRDGSGERGWHPEVEPEEGG